MGGIALWSTNAASNDTADPDIYLVEGQDPPSLNNAVRAVMASLRASYLDASGTLFAPGVPSGALTLGTNQQLGAAENLKNGFTISFQVSDANTGPCTLNVDGTGAKPLRRQGNIELGPGDLAPSIVYTALFRDDRFLIVSPTIARPGRIEAFGSVAAPPPGWIECNGATVSRIAFAALFSAIGETNGATTFQIPDGNGRTIFGRDNGKGRLSSAGGLTGAVGDVGGSATATLTLAQMPAHDHGGNTGDAGAHNHGGSTGNGGAHDHGGSTGSGGAHNHNASTDTAPAHSHNGSIGGGSHGHNGSTALSRSGTAGSGNEITGLWNGAKVDDATSSTTPSYTLTINNAGAHNHDVTLSAAPNHDHNITAAPNHAHAITPALDHAHAISSAGSGQGHANIPPAFVGVWAIKT